MTLPASIRRQFRLHRQFGVAFAAIVVGLHGLFILATSLLDEVAVHRGTRLNDANLDIPLLIGLSLLYLSVLLRRRKRTAWGVTVGAYAVYLTGGALALLNFGSSRPLGAMFLIRTVVLPLLIVCLLLSLHKQFRVQSDTEGFRLAARTAVLILLAAFVYGVAGFFLLDKSDFHQEISVTSAIHHTIDQFDLTTARPLHTYTRRAHLFVDSLSFVSVGAVAYALISLFQPLRARFSDQAANRERMRALLETTGAPSEDFFKLWPHDKHYFFDDSGRAGLALHVYRGVALCIADPAGNQADFGRLLDAFADTCFSNDWLPALIHVEDKHRQLYVAHDFALQKIGQEAVLNIEHFKTTVSNTKYFRQINNKFSKQSFSAELLSPPHHQAVIKRLKTISDEWLEQPGRVEHGFVMGYFSENYLQQCRLMVVRDAAGTIQAFLNQVPAAFDTVEATYDMLRYAKDSLGNSNDFLLMSFIDELAAGGYRRLNLGLCPLAGLDEVDDTEKTLLDTVLRFAYANGDRFYSFSGLQRFKAKYEPEWHDRYIAYRGGVRGFSRVMNALARAMRVSKHQRSASK